MGDFDGITRELKDVYKGQSAYSKALEKVRPHLTYPVCKILIMLFAEIQRQTTPDFGLRCAVFPSHFD